MPAPPTPSSSDTPSPRRPRLLLLSGLAWLAVIGAIPMVLAAWFWHDPLRECSRVMLTLHYGAFMAQTFVYHAGLAMLGVMLVAMIARRRRLLVAAAVVFVFAAGPDFLTLVPKRVPKLAGETLKIMSVNLMYGRGDHAGLLAQLRDESPDLVMFQEWTPQAASMLRPDLVAMFPHASEQPRDDAFGQAVFSRLKFVGDVRTYPPGRGFDVPQLSCAVDLAGSPIVLTNVHIYPPMSRGAFAAQRAMAHELAAWCANRSGVSRPDVLIGDFNAVAGSSLLRGVLPAEGSYGFAQNLAGFWRGSTWPRIGFLAHMPGIRLDHAIVRDTLVCTDSRTGADFGSDHRPVIITIARPAK